MSIAIVGNAGSRGAELMSASQICGDTMMKAKTESYNSNAKKHVPRCNEAAKFVGITIDLCLRRVASGEAGCSPTSDMFNNVFVHFVAPHETSF
jgi:hypothetical protein